MTNFRWSRVFTACILALMTAAPAHASHWLTWIDELSGPGPFGGYQVTAELLCVGKLPNEDRISALANDKTSTAVLESMQQITIKALDANVKVMTLNVDANEFNNFLQTEGDLHAAGRTVRQFPRCRADRENVITALFLEYGRFDDKNTKHDDKYTGLTRLSNAQLIAYFPLHRVLGPHFEPNRVTRALELGVGAGTYHLRGTTAKNTEVWMPAVPLRIRIIPAELFYRSLKAKPSGKADNALGRENEPPSQTGIAGDTGSRTRRLLQTVQVKAGWDYLPTKARWDELFQTTGGGSGFENSNSQELIWTWGLQVDLGQVAWALFDRPSAKK